MNRLVTQGWFCRSASTLGLRGMNTARTIAGSFVVGTLSIACSVAYAQEIGIDAGMSPPKHQSLTNGRVDPKTGEFVIQNLDLSVGSGSFPSRLDLIRIQSSKQRAISFSLDGRAICTTCAPYTINNGMPPFNFHPSVWGGVDIVLFGTTYSFGQDGSGSFLNLKKDGATLQRDVADKRFEFRSREGLKAYFDFSTDFTCGYTSAGGVTSHSQAICQQVRYIETPNGESISYRYATRESPDYREFPLAYLSEVVNSRGYGIRFAYDYSSDPTAVTGATAFRSSCVSLDTVICDQGNLASVTYGYDGWSFNGLPPARARLRYVIDPLGKRTDYEYGLNSYRVASEKRPSNPAVKVFTNEYSSDGKVISQKDAASNATTYSYGASETVVTDPLGNVTRYGFSGNSPYPVYLQDGNGNRTNFTYDEWFRLTKEQSAEGNSVENTLDDRGNLTTRRYKAKSGSGLADQVATAVFPACSDSNYRICNKPTSTTDVRGAVTNYQYDANHGGLLVSLDPPNADGLRSVTRVGYASFAPATGSQPPVMSGVPDVPAATVTLPATHDRCLSSVQGVGFSFVCPTANLVRTSYDYMPSTTASRTSFELRKVVVDPSGANLVTEYFYDRVGDIAAEDSPRAGEDLTVYVSDAARRLKSVSLPAVGGVNPSLQHTYDADGRLIATARSLAGTWAAETVAYDVRGLVASRTGADGTSTTYTYDAAGRPYETSKTVDGSTRATRSTFDAGGRETATQIGIGSPLVQTYSAATYSANGKVLSQTDAAGHVSTFCYDGFDRLIERRYPAPGNGTAPACSVIAPGGTLPTGVTRERYVYSTKGDLTSTTLRNGSTVSFNYDSLGRMIGKDVPEADRDVTYAYDLLGRRTAATLPATNANLSVAWTYDKIGRLLASSGPYGRIVSYAYDPSMAWSEVQWPDGHRVKYGSDVLGRITDVTEVGGPILASFEYDELSRRTAATYGNAATRTTASFNTQHRLANLTHNLNGTAQDVSYGFTYNEAGQIRTRNVSNAAFALADPDGTERSYYASTGTSTPGGNGLNQYAQITPGPTTLTYNLNGNLTREAGSSTLDYGYDSEGQLVSANGATFVYDAIGRLAEIKQGVTSTRMLYDGPNMIGEYDESSGSLQRRVVHGTRVDEPIVVYEGGARYWLYADERGSIVAKANASGTATAIARYDAWGTPNNNAIGRFGFTGQMWLPQQQLYHFKARAYSPVLGRFLQPDPSGEAGGMNLYAYAFNDPINLYDPSGLSGQTSSNYQINLPTIVVRPDPSTFFVGGSTSGGLNYAGMNASLSGSGIRSSMLPAFSLSLDPLWSTIYAATDGWSPSQTMVDISAGFGDGVSSALTLDMYSTADFREDWGIDGGVDEGSGTYQVSKVVGQVEGAFTGGVATAKGLAKLSNFQSFRWLNQNRYLRFGPGKPGPGLTKVDMMRIGPSPWNIATKTRAWWTHWRIR